MDKRFSILTVDDEPVNIELMRAALKDDYEILTALSGQDAIEQLEEQAPDLILLDVMMPDFNGFDVCRIIKADERFADIPIIFLTASLETIEGELQGLEVGAIDYLVKPVNLALLRLRIRNHLALKERNELVKEQRDLLIRQKEELRTSRDDIGRLLQATDQGIYGIDISGHCTFINRAALGMIGYSQDECLEKDMHDLIHHSHTDGSPYPVAECPVYRAKNAGVGCHLDHEVFWHKDGTSFPVEYSSYPIVKDSEIVGAVVTFSNIAERRQSETELRKLSRAVQQSSVTTVITDTLGSIEFVNPKFTELTGYTAEEAIGQNPRMLNAKQTPPETFVDLWATIKSGKTWKGELLNKTKDGSLFWEMAIISPLYDENGVITHYLAVKEDITEKKKIDEQLTASKVQADAANEAKSAFLANMSHEIRTPMNGVVSMSGLLLETDLSAEQRDYAEIISRSGENLLILIDEILDFSKIEAGKLELERAYFDLQLLLDDINRLLAYKADAAGLGLNYNIEPGMPIILKGDPGRVRQIITNLVGNALKFTKQGAVAVNASLVSDRDDSAIIRFAISDTGIGIPASRLSAIFAPFTQVDASTTRKYGGTGLGLTICKQLAGLMGGEIGVTSEEGKGSTFWFTVRFEKQSAEAVKAAQEIATPARLVTPPVDAGLNNLTARILLAEDNLINQKVALHLLKSLGYTADVVADGQQALEALAKINYDLVLMDCMMPNMDGFEATCIIRAQSSGVLDHNVPIIAMTANAMKEDRDKCLASGMDDYVPKPVKKDLLAAVLEKWLSPARLLQRKTIEVGNQNPDILSRLTVLYVEDDEMTREMYSLFLSGIVGVLITANNGAEGLEAYHKHQPDIIITDITMPVMDGLEMLKQIRTSNTTIPVIVLSALETSDSLNQSNDFGFLRYEMKSLSRTKLKVTLLECADVLLDRGAPSL
ncbi:MAG: response regulator [Desulfuromonadales bacterium]